MTDGDESREQGVEFEEFEETMESIDYPVDHETVVEHYGDEELELPNGTTTVEEVLAPLQDQDQTYQDSDELQVMIKNMVGDDAVGREGQSDRGASTETDADGDDQSL
jgi:hypothetical protein